MGQKLKNLVGISLFGIALASTIGVSAAEVGDYYQGVDSEANGTALAEALSTLVKKTHTHELKYDNLWSLYGTSDVYPGTNKIWDTYSEVLFNKGTDQAGSYKKEGDAYNREHTVPQSWFSENLPMRGDAYHVLATDGYVNNRRGSFLYGEVGSATYTSNNGSKLGSSKLSGYSGTVFEPIDEYKGDIARGYFYMAIRYKDQCGSWTSGAKDVFKSSYPYLTDYALDLFTKWSHLDPVSDKEIIRNDAVAEEQGNRNPFIDHPEWVDTIWKNSYVDTPTKTAYSVDDVVSAIDALQSSATDTNVYKAYAKYCRLNTSDKKLVTNSEALFTKVASKSGTSINLSNYWAEIIDRNSTTIVINQEKIDTVIELIDKLPETITLANKQDVLSVQDAYASLKYAERILVTNYSKLSKAIDTINALESDERVQNVIDMIAALPDTITLDDKDAVYNADNAFMALSFDERCNVTNAEKLTLALQMISALESTIYKQINSLDELEVGDKVLIVCPKSSYALGGLFEKFYRAGIAVAIKDDEIALPENSEATILTVEAGLTSGTYAFNTGDGYLVPSKEDKYSNLVTEATITEYSSYTVTINDGVANLVSPKAKNGIMAYSESHRDFTSYQTVTGDYTLALFKYTTAGMTVNEEKVNKVIDMINNLPNPLAYTDMELIQSIFTAYAELNTLERAEVTNYDVLRAASDEVSILIDKHYAEPAIEAINAIPSPITLSDEGCCQNARYTYDGTSPDSRKYVTNYDRLLEAEAEYEALFGTIDAFRNENVKSSLKFNYSASVTESNITSYNVVESLSDLKDGNEIVITNMNADKAFAAFEEGKNYASLASVTSNSTGTQLTTIGSSIVFTLEAVDGAVNEFYFKSDYGYLTSPNAKSLSWKTKKDDAHSWTITVDNKIVTMVHSKLYLKYNESATRFTSYESKSGNVELISFFKKTGGVEATYTVSNASIRFGEFMKKSVYEELLTKGTNVTFGIELALDPYAGYTEYELTPVFVNQMGAKEEDPNGDYVQYAVVIPVSEKHYDTYLFARSYVSIDGVKFYTVGVNYSMHALAEYYIKNANELGITDSAIIGALGVF